MKLLWTGRETIEVVGFGSVPRDGTIDVPDHVGQALLGGRGWEKAPAEAPKRAAKPAAERSE